MESTRQLRRRGAAPLPHPAAGPGTPEAAALARAAEQIEEALFVVDAQGRLVATGGAWAQVMGPPGALTEGAPFSRWFDADSGVELARALEEVGTGARTERLLRLKLHGDEGRSRTVEVSIVAAPSGAGACGVLRDVTRRELEELRFAAIALQDPVTGLLNRSAFEERLGEAVAVAKAGDGRLAIGYVDVDQFKDINETLGHAAGDSLLRALAARLRAGLPAGAVLARWAGDAFVVLLPGTSLIAARELAEKLRDTARAPVQVAGRNLGVTVSIGLAALPEHPVGSLLSHADRALSRAKQAGRNTVADPGPLAGLTADRAELQARLIQAVAAGEIDVHFQPIVNASDGKVHGAEALARWKDSVAGWVSPAVFIPLAERIGLIGELSDCLFRKALAHLARWRAAGSEVRLSLNLSQRQLGASDFVESFTGLLNAHGLGPADVVAEITESLAMHSVQGAEGRLLALVEAGYSLSLDDFGTGYSSLSQLHRIPLHELKIDLSFVRRMQTPHGLQIVRTIAQLGHNLGLELVAEGVEDERTAGQLRELGVTRLQGYHYSRPVPAAEFFAKFLQGAEGGEAA